MTTKINCLYCKLNEASHAEEIAPKKSKHFWRKRQLLLSSIIVEKSQIRKSDYCSEEHLYLIKGLRESARFTNRTRIKAKVKLVCIAMEVLKNTEIQYETILKYYSSDTPTAKMAHARVMHQKYVLSQRRRRLKDLMPQVPEDKELLEAYLTREFLEAPESRGRA